MQETAPDPAAGQQPAPAGPEDAVAAPRPRLRGGPGNGPGLRPARARG